MRIDAGSHRGVKLAAPASDETRPTSDRARQAVFNILAHRYEAIRDAKVLDVFAGSGALGLEALSRGAERASFIESADALRPPRAASNWAPCSLIFLDPPYGKGLIPPTLFALRKTGWIAPEALVVAEVDRKEALEPGDGFEVLDDRQYGKARILLLQGQAGT
jgi:16S rRNA (guanine966-N2)-methyltransferase